jgi:hypothetical protein
MAKVKIQGHASGTGVLTVTAPNTSTDRTITLPDEDVTLGAATPSIDDNGNATAITIDSDENVLIGKTTYVGGSGVTGIDIRPAGMVNIAREGDTLMYMNRKTSDGDIVEFRKDGTTKGNIGTNGSNIYLNSEGGTLKLQVSGTDTYNGDSTAWYPATDNAKDLGYASFRYKDLYLSGGLKVGGTGTANTLDDYEEGSWSPTWTSQGGTLNTNTSYSSATYTKIGNLVTVAGRLYTNSVSSPTGLITVSGLPFTVGSGNNKSPKFLFPVFELSSDIDHVPLATLIGNSTTLTVAEYGFNGSGTGFAQRLDNDAWALFTFSYFI